MCAGFHTGFNEILDVFKDMKRQIYIKSIIMLPIVAVEVIMTS